MNIKDSYIHGDLAVVRSIEGLSVSNGSLVLKYKKADSNSTQETKTIAISSFNSALSNKFVTLDTAQVITGLKIFNSNTTGFNTSTREITGNPLIIGRSSYATETLHVGVDDNTAYFIHRQDETASNFAFIGTWDDTESGGGAGAGYKRIDFVMNQASSPYISINGNKVWHEGNLQVASTSSIGLIPKLALAATSSDGDNKQYITKPEYDYVLTYSSNNNNNNETAPKWRRLPRIHYGTTDTHSSGYYKISIASTISWMLCFTIRVYQGYHYYDIVISGYNYADTKTWYNPTATMIGSSSDNGITVIFGHDADNNLWVALNASSYTALDIINIANGYNQISDLYGTFSISYVSSLTGTTDRTVTAYLRTSWIESEHNSDYPIAFNGSTSNSINASYYSSKFKINPSTGKLTSSGDITASKFIKSGATANNILLADGSDIAQSTLTNAFTGTVSVTNTSDSPSKLQVTVGSKSGSVVVDYAKQAHDLYRTELTNGLDLNSLTNEGVYVTTSSAVIQSLVNNPSGVTIGEYRLEVVQLNSESTGSYVILNLTRTNGNVITNYQRARNSSGTWSSWHIQYDDITLTKSVITNLIGTTTYAPYNANGYLPLDGGTLTGNLTIKKSSSDIGTYVTKTDSNGTTIRQLLFGIGGASGVAGIYDYATNSWIVSIAKNSPYAATFNGNALTSTLTKYTLTSSAYHLVGVNENLTSTATARSSIGRNDVLVTASGAIQAVDTAGFNLGTSATMKYNTANQSIDFIFN